MSPDPNRSVSKPVAIVLAITVTLAGPLSAVFVGTSWVSQLDPRTTDGGEDPGQDRQEASSSDGVPRPGLRMVRAQLLGAAASRGLDVDPVAVPEAPATTPLRTALRQWIGVQHGPPHAEQSQRLDEEVRDVPEELREPLARLVLAHAQATILQREALSELTPDQRERIEPMLAQPTGLAQLVQDPPQVLEEAARSVDLATSVQAAVLLVDAARVAYPAIHEATPDEDPTAGQDPLTGASTSPTSDAPSPIARAIQEEAPWSGPASPASTTETDARDDQDPLAPLTSYLALAGGSVDPNPDPPRATELLRSMEDASGTDVPLGPQAPARTSSIDTLPANLDRALGRILEASTAQPQADVHTGTRLGQAHLGRAVAMDASLPTLATWATILETSPVDTSATTQPASAGANAIERLDEVPGNDASVRQALDFALRQPGVGAPAASSQASHGTDVVGALAGLYAALDRTPDPGWRTAVQRTVDGFDADTKRGLTTLVDGTAHATRLVDDALSELSPEEAKRLQQNTDLLQAFLAGESLSTSDQQRARELAGLASQIDTQRLARAAATLARASDQARGLLPAPTTPASQHPDAEAPWPACTSTEFSDCENGIYFRGPTSLVLLGTPGDSSYDTRESPPALLVDPGGDDAYKGPVGTANLIPPAALALDMGGHDTFESGSLAYGVGRLGVGVLVQAGGDTAYRVTAQGEGYAALGVGALADLGGDDTYGGVSDVQATTLPSLWGTGLLLDTEGNDRYKALTGTGRHLGGTFLDLSGRDSYDVATQPLGVPLTQPIDSDYTVEALYDDRRNDALWLDGEHAWDYGFGLDVNVSAADTDDDGTPNLVETLADSDAHAGGDQPADGLEPTREGLRDADGDGFSNATEEAAGTDPDDASSAPASPPARLPGPTPAEMRDLYQRVRDRGAPNASSGFILDVRTPYPDDVRASAGCFPLPDPLGVERGGEACAAAEGPGNEHTFQTEASNTVRDSSQGERSQVDANLGLLALGDVTNTTYEIPYLVSLDLGGNDTYQEGAGGAVPLATTSDGSVGDGEREQSLLPLTHLDLAGDDIYRGQDLAQGAGGGLLVDLAGEDAYEGRDATQGALGGVLYDAAGDDIYDARRASQAAAIPVVNVTTTHVGFGGAEIPILPARSNTHTLANAHTTRDALLLDADGADTYDAGAASQAFATSLRREPYTANNTTATAQLVDLGGHDRYNASALSQGTAGPGGFALLADRAGDDTYLAHDLVAQAALDTRSFHEPGGSADEAAKLAGLALLADASGVDVYRAERADGAPVDRTPEREDNVTRSRVPLGATHGSSLALMQAVHADLEGSDSDADGDGWPDAVETVAGTDEDSQEQQPAAGNGTGFHVNLPTAGLAIGNADDTRYTDAYVLAVDVGGRNAYENNAGGPILEPLSDEDATSVDPEVGRTSFSGIPVFEHPVTAVFDASLAPTTFRAPRDLAQAASFLTVGSVITAGGSNTFEAPTEPRATIEAPPGPRVRVDGRADAHDEVPKTSIAWASDLTREHERNGTVAMWHDGSQLFLRARIPDDTANREDVPDRFRVAWTGNASDPQVFDRITVHPGRDHTVTDEKWDGNVDDDATPGTWVEDTFHDRPTRARMSYQDGGWTLEVARELGGVRSERPLEIQGDDRGEVRFVFCQPTRVTGWDGGIERSDDGRVVTLENVNDSQTLDAELRFRTETPTLRYRTWIDANGDAEDGDQHPGAASEGCHAHADTGTEDATQNDVDVTSSDVLVSEDVNPVLGNASALSITFEDGASGDAWRFPPQAATHDGEGRFRADATLAGEARDWRAFLPLGPGEQPRLPRAGPVLVQGAALGGVSVLASASAAGGHDTYTASRFAQGFGTVRGIGLLSDLAGSDTYDATAWAQGAATTSEDSLSTEFPRDGLGLLVDVTGNDVYEADRNAQGFGNRTMSQATVQNGVFLDLDGYDRYAYGDRTAPAGDLAPREVAYPAYASYAGNDRAWRQLETPLADSDEDGLRDQDDNCPDDYNPEQTDTDGNGAGNACDADNDQDEVEDDLDNCPNTDNTVQNDNDDDGVGDACDDSDGDGVLDVDDNCPDDYNPEQTDTDGDGIGDACDPQNNADKDGDGVLDEDDNCPDDYNPEQTDTDGDGVGDACDADNDGDGFDDDNDNCPDDWNPTQANVDEEGYSLEEEDNPSGDACETDDGGDAEQVSAGGTLTCVRRWGYVNGMEDRHQGDVDCWGKDGNAADKEHGKASQISAGEDLACALHQNGSVHCWTGSGDSEDTNLYRPSIEVEHDAGDPPSQPPQADVKTDRPAVEVDAGGDQACLRLRAGTLLGGTVDCWTRAEGTWTEWDGYEGSKSQKVSVGRTHACVVEQDNDVLCWGGNARGQADPQDDSPSVEPTPVYPSGNHPPNVLTVSAGGTHTCVLATDGDWFTREIVCWGGNADNQSHPDDPAHIVGPSAAYVRTGGDWSGGLSGEQAKPVDVSAGGSHTCALLANRTVVCWGDNAHGQADPETSQTTVNVTVVYDSQTTGVDATQLTAGRNHTCARLANGTVTCWGDNAHGQADPDDGADEVGKNTAYNKGSDRESTCTAGSVTPDGSGVCKAYVGFTSWCRPQCGLADHVLHRMAGQPLPRAPVPYHPVAENVSKAGAEATRVSNSGADRSPCAEASERCSTVNTTVNNTRNDVEDIEEDTNDLGALLDELRSRVPSTQAPATPAGVDAAVVRAAQEGARDTCQQPSDADASECSMTLSLSPLREGLCSDEAFPNDVDGTPLVDGTVCADVTLTVQSGRVPERLELLRAFDPAGRGTDCAPNTPGLRDRGCVVERFEIVPLGERDIEEALQEADGERTYRFRLQLDTSQLPDGRETWLVLGYTSPRSGGNQLPVAAAQANGTLVLDNEPRIETARLARQTFSPSPAIGTPGLPVLVRTPTSNLDPTARAPTGDPLEPEDLAEHGDLTRHDVVYLNRLTSEDPAVPTDGDVRLTAFDAELAAGTAVVSGDVDARLAPPLEPLDPSSVSVCHLDPNENRTRELGEPLVLDTDADACSGPVEAGHLRLTSTVAAPAGTLVEADDPEVGVSTCGVGHPKCSQTGQAILRYNETSPNVNGFNASEDPLYVDVVSPDAKEVDEGDLRLTIPGSEHDPLTVVSDGDGDVGNSLSEWGSSSRSIADAVAFYDVRGDGTTLQLNATDTTGRTREAQVSLADASLEASGRPSLIESPAAAGTVTFPEETLAKVTWTPRTWPCDFDEPLEDCPDGLYPVNVSARDAVPGRLGEDDEDRRWSPTSRVGTALLDGTPPETEVLLPRYVGVSLLDPRSGTFDVPWQVQDGAEGTGATQLRVYATPGEGAARLDDWERIAIVNSTARTSVPFLPSPGEDTYTFATVAMDSAGNVEGIRQDLNFWPGGRCQGERTPWPTHDKRGLERPDLDDHCFPDRATATRAAFLTGLRHRDGTTVTLDPELPAITDKRLALADGAEPPLVSPDRRTVPGLPAGEDLLARACVADPGPSSIERVQLAFVRSGENSSALTSKVPLSPTGDGCYEAVDAGAHTGNETRFPEGLWTVSMQAFDGAGNIGRSLMGAYYLDASAPEIVDGGILVPDGQAGINPGQRLDVTATVEEATRVRSATLAAPGLNETGTVPLQTSSRGRIQGGLTVDAGVPDGTYPAYLNITDVLGNERVIQTPVTVDTTPVAFEDPPELRNLAADADGEVPRSARPDGFDLVFNTSEPARFEVLAGPEPGNLSTVHTARGPFETNHAANVTGLSAGSVYTVKVTAWSKGGLEATSKTLHVRTGASFNLNVTAPQPGATIPANATVTWQPVPAGNRSLPGEDAITVHASLRHGPSDPWRLVGAARGGPGVHELPLDLGSFPPGKAYELRVVARAGEEVTSQVIAPLTLDKHGPSGHLVAPANGFTNQTRPTLVVDLADALDTEGSNALDAAWIDGVEAPFTVNESAQRARVEAPRALGPGQHALTLEASDETGNTAETTIPFSVDRTPPELTVRDVETPIPVRPGGNLTLPVFARDAGQLAHVSAELAGASTRTLDRQGALELELTAPGHVSGEHELSLVAVDAAGNRVTQTLPVRVDATPPLGVTYDVDEHPTSVHLTIDADEPVYATVRTAEDRFTAGPGETVHVNATGLTPGRTHTLAIQLRDVAGNQVEDSLQVATPEDLLAPTAPGELAARPQPDGSIALSWAPAEDNAGVDRYVVERQGPNATTWRLLDAVEDTAYLDEQPSPGDTYGYRVHAVDAAEQPGPTVASDPVTARGPPRLSDGGVTPDEGAPGDAFTFHVNYTDPLGRAPASIAAVLDGTRIPLEPGDGSLTDGRRYEATVSVPAEDRSGPHRFHFEARPGHDGSGLLEFPADRQLTGPTVTVALDGQQRDTPATSPLVLLALAGALALALRRRWPR